MSDVLTSSHQSSGDGPELTRIYVIGDSHTQVFGGSKLFTVCPIGPATAYNLKKENSATDSNKKLLNIIKKINIHKDIVILVFGEIDCRIHIYYKYMINNKTISISELIDHTIYNYGAVLRQLRDMNIIFCIYGIPAAGFEENIYKYPFYASPELRSKIYREFNDKLKTFCEKNKYRYIDIYPVVSDDNGFLKEECAADDVHLNETIIPFIESWLSKEFNSEIYIDFLRRCPPIEVTKAETFEIEDNEINAEEIMSKIKEKIQTRMGLNVLPKPEDMPVNRISEKSRELEYISSNWDIHNNNYSISSHRRILGKALITGRELVHREVQLYIDPMIWKQRDFNLSIVKIFNDIIERLGRISDQIEDRITKSQSAISAQVEDRITKSQSAISAQVEDRITKSQSAISAQVEDRIAESQSAISAQVEDRIAKSHFEERFRGSRADIKRRQSAFIKYFKDCENVLDIGCGRGVFLELLREQEIGARGIDIDEDMVNFCKSKGLDIEKSDAVSYLNKLNDKSLDGIFIDQVVEHLEPEYLIRMLSLCYMKLIYGGAIIIETVNPLSSFSFANFYIDMSQKRPVHPETLKFLTNMVGFRDTEIELIAPVPEEAKLKKIKIKAEKNQYSEEIRIYNNNIDILNSIIYGPQDYILIGKK